MWEAWGTVGRGGAVLWKAAASMARAPAHFHSVSQQPQAPWRPWRGCDQQSIHFLLSLTGLSGIKRNRKSKPLPRIHFAEFRQRLFY